MKPTEQQIEDCRVRGIVPGAVIVDADGLQGTVWPTEKWYGILCLTCGDGYLFAIADGEWATVITPAPKPATLTPGMACLIPSAAGRQWIKELAEEKGLWGGVSDIRTESQRIGIWVMDFPNGVYPEKHGKLSGFINVEKLIVVPAHEFIRLLMDYQPPVPPKTTEELLKEAVRILKLLSFAADAPDTDMEEARAFLKSIKS